MASTQHGRASPAPREPELVHPFEDIAGGVPAALYVFDLRRERAVWGNRGVPALLGHDEAAVAALDGALLPHLMHPDDLARFPEHLARLQALRPGETARLVYRMRHADGGWRWFESLDAPHARDEAGTVVRVAGAAFDVTERQEREEAQRLLLGEMAHRQRNLFAVVGALVRTARRVAEPAAQPALARLGDQIRALAAAHEVAGTGRACLGEARGATLGTLLRRTLDPYAAGADIRVDGADPALPADAVTPMALIAHELATNALKHGALGAGGRLSVTLEETGAEIVMLWRETGVGPERAADRRPGDERGGFGLELTERAARQLGGRLSRRRGLDGLSVELRVPRRADVA